MTVQEFVACFHAPAGDMNTASEYIVPMFWFESVGALPLSETFQIIPQWAASLSHILYPVKRGPLTNPKTR